MIIFVSAIHFLEDHALYASRREDTHTTMYLDFPAIRLSHIHYKLYPALRPRKPLGIHNTWISVRTQMRWIIRVLFGIELITEYQLICVEPETPYLNA